MNIRISNISLNTTDPELRRLFFQFGIVDYAIVNRNSLNGRSLKTGEISMPISSQARQAIVSLNKSTFNGMIICVAESPADLY